MKCLVTGGAGLIGSHIVDKMLSLGHDVVILDNLHPQTHLRKPNWIPKEAKFIQGDVNNYDDLSNALQGVEYIHTKQHLEVLQMLFLTTLIAMSQAQQKYLR